MPDLSDAFLTLYFELGVSVNRIRFHSIFSSLVALVIQIRVQIDNLNMPDFSDAVLTLYFEPGVSVNRIRFHSIFSSLVALVIQVRVRIDC